MLGIGFFAASASGGGAGAAAYELISTQILSSTATSITFASIPSTYKHLQIRAVMKSTDPIDFSTYDVALRFNSDSGSNYSYHRLSGNGSSVSSSAASSLSYIPAATIATSNGVSSTIFSPFVVDILDYSSSVKNKTTRTLSGNTGGGSSIQLSSGAWYNTAAITSLSLFMNAVSWSFSVGSRVSLYGSKG